jgi:CAP-Gly domain
MEGMVRFVGQVPGKDGQWVGIELNVICFWGIIVYRKKKVTWMVLSMERCYSIASQDMEFF